MTPIQALRKLIDRADDLIAAIEGTTDQFETEVACLQQGVTEAEQVLVAKAKQRSLVRAYKGDAQ
jgi:hypothetical protein